MPHVRHLRKCEDRDVLVYVPSGPGPHPILCFLHGAGEAAQHEDGRVQPPDVVENHGPPAAVRDKPDAAHWPSIAQARQALQPFLVVCPQREKYGQWTSRDGEWVVDAMNEAAREFNGDPKRRFLTGFSWGGLGVLRMATGKQRDEWAAFWAVDPSPERSAARGRFLVHHGTRFTEGDAKTYRNGINADLKDIFNLKQKAKEWWALPDAHQAFLELKLEHVPTCQAAYADPDAYKWLLQPAAAPAVAAAPSGDPVRAAVDEGNRKFGAAVGAKDYAAMAALYTENAKVLPPDMPVVTGRKAIEEFWRGAAAKLGVTAATLTTVDLEVAGDTACETGEAALTLPSGTVKVKYLVVWRKDGGTWRLHRDMWNAAG
jgi:ketosteroid isomerase-like protein/dienelactone hydrolase